MPNKLNVPALAKVFQDCLDIGIRKNHDYAAARDVILDNGIRGIATRLDDKQARILSLTTPGHEAAVKDESLRDTLRDMVNYAAYGIMLLDGTWGQKPPAPAHWVDLMGFMDEARKRSGIPVTHVRFGGKEMEVGRLAKLFERYGKEPDAFYSSVDLTRDNIKAVLVSEPGELPPMCRCLPTSTRAQKRSTAKAKKAKRSSR